MLRKKVDAAGSVRVYAAEIGASAGYVSDALTGRRYPGPLILANLGLESEKVLETVFKYFPKET